MTKSKKKGKKIAKSQKIKTDGIEIAVYHTLNIADKRIYTGVCSEFHSSSDRNIYEHLTIYEKTANEKYVFFETFHIPEFVYPFNEMEEEKKKAIKKLLNQMEKINEKLEKLEQNKR